MAMNQPNFELSNSYNLLFRVVQILKEKKKPQRLNVQKNSKAYRMQLALQLQSCIYVCCRKLWQDRRNTNTLTPAGVSSRHTSTQTTFTHTDGG